MTGCLRSIAVLALLAVAVPAVAFVRETTTPGHPETGHCLWWRNRLVTYRVNAAAVTATGCRTAAAAEAAADLGFAAWAGAKRPGEPAPCTDFAFAEGAPSTQTALGHDGVNLVAFRTRRCSDVVGLDPCAATPGACAAKFNCWDDDYGVFTIGVTTTTFDTRTGEILDADMELFAWDGELPALGHYFTCAEPASGTCSDPPYGRLDCTWVDVAAVVTHEAGHMFGLDHVCDAFVAPYDACPPDASVMEPQVGSVARRGLGPDDVAGICTIYPAGRATLTCAPPDPPRSGGGGCSSAGGVGVPWAIAAWLGWLAKRRRTFPSQA